jgi:hypothetical protein
MTESDQGQLDDLEPGPGTNPLQTGHTQIDHALRELTDLASAPLADHHDRLAEAHEALDEALHRPDSQANDAESG